MLLMVIGLLLNIVVTPVFLFVLKGGIRGVAAGMVMCQLVIFIPTILHFIKRNQSLPLQLQSLKLNFHITALIVKIGFTPFLINSLMSVPTFIANNRLMTYGGSSSIEVYTISSTFMIFVTYILIGLSQGIQPIIGYNYGAKKINRLFETVRITGITGAGIGIIGFAIAWLFFDSIAKIFLPDNPIVVEESVQCLHILSISLPVTGFIMIVSAFFQSIGAAKQALVLSLIRQIGFLIPFLLLFPLLWQTKGVWYAIPSSDFLAFLIAILFFAFHAKKIRKIN
jgi:Na+-driven multidrug efflux pump